MKSSASEPGLSVTVHVKSHVYILGPQLHHAHESSASEPGLSVTVHVKSHVHILGPQLHHAFNSSFTCFCLKGDKLWVVPACATDKTKPI